MLRTRLTTFSGGVYNLEGITEGNWQVTVWSQDQIFVIDQLERINAADPENRFTNCLDLERLGVFGQSLDGSTANVTCSLDARGKADANGDGPVYGEVIEAGLDQPFLYLLSDSRFFANPEFYANARGPYYEAAFAGFEHLDFGDFTLWPNATPLHETLWLGRVEGERAVELTRAALLTFFDQYVKGRGRHVHGCADSVSRDHTHRTQRLSIRVGRW